MPENARQELGLLLVGAELGDGRDTQAHARRQRDTDRLVHPTQLFDGDAQAGEVTARSAVLRWGGDTEESQLTHLPHGVQRERVLAIPPRRMGCDLVLGEVERPLFKAVMDYTDGNQSQAAGILGINRGTLRTAGS